MTVIRRFIPVVLVAVFALALMIPSHNVQAATFDLTICDPDPLINGAALITAITTANNNGQDDTINLAAGCTYLLNTVNNTGGGQGGNGLPLIVDAATQGTLTINGNGATIIRDAAAPQFRLMYISSGANVTLDSLTLSNGAGDGGGFYNSGGTVALTNSTLSGNGGGGFGGGFLNNASGTVTLSNSTLSGNTATTNGGGFFNSGTVTVSNSTLSGNTSDNSGGGFQSVGGTVTVSNSTLSGNTANLGGGFLSTVSSTVSVTNSTFSDNTANVNGGGFYNTGNGTVGVTNSTLSDNTATGAGGGFYNDIGTVTLNNSIIANSTNGGDCVSTGTVNGSRNLIEDGSCATVATLTGDPALGALQTAPNGTQVYPLLSGSPAIDAGDNTAAASAGLTTDQRGEPRFANDLSKTDTGVGTAPIVDIGAYEVADSCAGVSYTIADGDIAGLIFAINCANGDPANNTIALAANGTYTLTTSDNSTGGAGDNGLPAILDASTSGTLTINGNGATITRSAVPAFRLFFISAGADLTLNDLTLSNGNNDDGAALYNDGGILTISDSTVTGSVASGDGGGLYHNAGTTSISNSTFSNNTATQLGAGFRTVSGTVNVTNSTFFSNTSASGGALFNEGPATVNVTNSTFSDNNASTNGGAFRTFGGTLNLWNNIFANSGANVDCTFDNGAVLNGSHNLIEFGCFVGVSGTNNTTNTVLADPMLGALQTAPNGTQVYPLLDGSPVIDGGSNTAANNAGLTTDQAGQGRFYDDTGVTDTGAGTAPIVDIGAFEKQTNSVAPEISINDVTLAEGDAGTTNFSFTVTLSQPYGQTITVDYLTTDGTATVADSDYTALTATTLTFAVGETSKQVTVAVNADTTFEADETFTVDLSNALGATILDNQGLGTITNDDTQPAISIDDVTEAEGNAATSDFIFTITLSNASYQTVTVDYVTTDGTASDGGDFDYNGVFFTATMTFNPGVTSQQITVTANGDTTFEADETFTFDLSNPTNATIADNQGLATILNDDALPTITIADVTLAEGDSGTTDFSFTVTLSTPSSQTVTFDMTTANGTAIASEDYLGVTTVVTIPPGETTRDVGVSVLADNMFEADETFTVNLSNATNAAITDNQATGTILNDDPAPSVTIDDVTLAEGTGTTTDFVFTVSLSNPSYQTIIVDYTSADGSATTASGDYTPVSGTLTFNPGETDHPITVTVNADSEYELDETFNLNLTNATAALIDDLGIATAINDDGIPTISIDDVSQAEGDFGTTDFTFNLTLSNPSAQPITVDFATADGTAIAMADYLPVTTPVTLTFPPGEVTREIGLIVFAEDTFEPNETFTFNLSNPTNATLADNQAVGTIINDDPQPTITIDSVSLEEDDTGITGFFFTVSLSNPSAQTITVDYVTTDGLATADDDYGATDGTLTFTCCTTVQTVLVEVYGDTNLETDETFAVLLSNATNATIVVAAGSGIIINDDGPPSVIIDDVVLLEGDSGITDFTFTATLSGLSWQPITVDFVTADGTATASGDYAALSGTLTFAPGTDTQQITVPVNGDTVSEAEETFTLTLSNPVNATIGYAEGVGTIINDDLVAISISDVMLAEGTGVNTSFVFTVSLSAADPLPVLVDYVTVDSTASIADSDYTAISGTLNFDPGVTSQQVTVIVNGDTVSENDETFTLSLDFPTNATIADNQGVGTILNDDTPGIVVTPTSGLTTTETGGTAQFTVVLGSQPSADVVIGLSSSDTSEGTVAPASLTFTPANWNVAQTVTVTGVDDTEVDGTVAYTIVTAPATSLDLFYSGRDADDVTVNNTDNDTPGVTVAPTALTLLEGESGTYTINLNTAPTSGSVTVQASFDGTALSLNGTTVSPLVLTFTDTTPQTVSVMVVDDNVTPQIITHTIGAGSAPEYLGLTVDSVTVNIGTTPPPVANAPTFPPPPPVPLCNLIGGGTNPIVRADVPSNAITNGAVFCRVLAENNVMRTDSAQIGSLELVQRGVIQAVDVFGLLRDGASVAQFSAPVKICLLGTGELFYLDATQAPRTVQRLNAFSENGYTCALIPNAGTMVLVNGQAAPPASQSAANQPSSALNGCQITTRGVTNLRDEAGTNGAIIARVPFNITLTALERRGDWLYVDNVGTFGWVNAGVVDLVGTCQ